MAPAELDLVDERAIMQGDDYTLAAPASEAVFDNGQHLLLGAYQSCLQLMRQVGANPVNTRLRAIVFSPALRMPSTLSVMTA